MRRFRTHYDNLKVSRDAPPEVIRSAYKALANKYHPDRNHGSERALRAMQAINTSFEALDDPVRRRAHDEWIDRKTGNAAPPPQQQASAPRPQYTPPKRQPTYTHAPPPKPLFEPNMGCFYWILGFIVIGLLGSLDQCSKRNSRSSDVAPAPTPTPLPTPTPAPPKPVQQLKAPFGIKWGETPERIKSVVAKADAKVVADGGYAHQRIIAVEGIEGNGLQRTVFRFVNNSLCEVALVYGEGAWTDSGYQMMERCVSDASDKYGEGYRFKNTDTEAAGIRKRVEGWAWVQEAGSLRMVHSSHQAEGEDSSQVVLTYTSAQFPPHETVAFMTEQPGRAPFKIQTEAGSNFLLKLVDPQTRRDVMRMFVVGGQEANFRVPVGEYELVYASGQKWYGNELLFGPETQYAKVDTVSRFTSAVSSADAAKVPDLERRQTAAIKALRDYMVRNKFAKGTIDFIFDGRDRRENLKGPERLTTEWWQQNVLDKVGNKPKLYNGLVDRLNAFNRAANALLKLHSEAGGYNGVVLTLYAVRGGNLETLPISAEDFLGGEDTP
jgi:hypothetical protein